MWPRFVTDGLHIMKPEVGPVCRWRMHSRKWRPPGLCRTRVHPSLTYRQILLSSLKTTECHSILQCTFSRHQSCGRLARWIKWRPCDVGEAKEGLENELWRSWSNGRIGKWAVTYVMQQKGWIMSWAYDVGEAKEGLENELWRRWSNGRVGEWVVT